MYWAGKLAADGRFACRSREEGWNLLSRTAKHGHIFARKVIANRKIRSKDPLQTLIGIGELLLASIVGTTVAVLNPYDERVRL